MLFFQRQLQGSNGFLSTVPWWELRLHTVGESTKTDNLPQHMKSYIVQASLKRDDLVLMGTDMNEEELLQGNSLSMLLVCPNEIKTKAYYKNLEASGKPTQPLHESHWGDLFGGLTDKYGNHWLFHCKR